MSSASNRWALLMMLTVLAVYSARAATFTWANTGTDFSAGGSWVNGTAPLTATGK